MNYAPYVRCKKCSIHISLLPTITSESIPSLSPCGWGGGIQNVACLACRYVCEYLAEDCQWGQTESPKSELDAQRTVHLLSIPCGAEGCTSALRIIVIASRGATQLHSKAIAASLFARNLLCGNGHRNIGPALKLCSTSIFELPHFGSQKDGEKC